MGMYVMHTNEMSICLVCAACDMHEFAMLWFFRTASNELYHSQLTFSEFAQLLSVDSPVES